MVPVQVLRVSWAYVWMGSPLHEVRLDITRDCCSVFTLTRRDRSCRVLKKTSPICCLIHLENNIVLSECGALAGITKNLFHFVGANMIWRRFEEVECEWRCDCVELTCALLFFGVS